MTKGVDLTADLQAWIRLAGLDTVQGSETNDGRTIIWKQGGERRYFIDFADNWYTVNSSDRMGPENFNFAGRSMGVTERYLYGLFGGSVRRNDLPMLKAPFERHELRGGYSIDKQSFAGHERHVLRDRSGSYVAVAALDRLVTLSHYLGATIEDIKTSFQAPDGKPLFCIWENAQP